MGLADQGKMIVRVSANEFQTKADHPSVPYGPEEIAEDAVRCHQAGATIIHFHSRYDDGRQALADDRSGAGLYRRALELTARRCDVIMEPTNLPHGDRDPSSCEDVPHIWSLADNPPAVGGLEIVNIDAFRFQHLRSGYDVHRHRLVTIDEKQKMRPELPFQLPPCIAEVRARRLTPFFGMFNMSDMRLLGHYAAEGLIPAPVLVQINFFCNLMWGPTPSVQALDAFLAEWRGHAIDAELCLFVVGLPNLREYEYFQEAALDRGVSFRVGIGDNPGLFAGGSPQMVDHYISLLARRGFSPASPDDLRRRVGLPTRGGALPS